MNFRLACDQVVLLYQPARHKANDFLMTGHAGNSDCFCFPLTSMFSSASSPETLRVSGKQNSLFPLGPVIGLGVKISRKYNKTKAKKLTQDSKSLFAGICF